MTEIITNIKPIPVKVILVGDSGVGKTSIITRYMNQFKSNIDSTITTTYYSKTEKIKNYELNMQIWDTVGQEQFRSLNSIFFKDAHICLLVYDITREDTFSSIRDYWYSAVIENGLEGVILGVAGNKNDLYIDEKVDKQEVRDFCNEINALFRFTSAVQNVSIGELFRELGARFVESPFMNEFGSEYFENKDGRNSIKLNDEKKNNDVKQKKKCC
jgi:Ras-related protein Rab-22